MIIGNDRVDKNSNVRGKHKKLTFFRVCGTVNPCSNFSYSYVLCNTKSFFNIFIFMLKAKLYYFRQFNFKL